MKLFGNRISNLLHLFRKPKPRILIETPYGYTTESMRLQAALNMRADDEIKHRVEAELSKKLGSAAKGLAEAKRRYPEAYQ